MGGWNFAILFYRGRLWLGVLEAADLEIGGIGGNA
jgi:hypothetical protein